MRLSLIRKIYIYKRFSLGDPYIEAKLKGGEAIIRNRVENENWKMARMFVEHFQMKHGYLNYTHISRELNQNGYKTRYGCAFTPTSVRRLAEDFLL